MFLEHINILELDFWRIMWHWCNDAENSALLHKIKLHFNIYSKSNQFFKIVIIFHNIIVLVYFWSNKCSLCEH